jgi:protein-L-isoaspartate(D-aspartate) O-methyltransferase
MVRTQLAARGITDPRVLAAMGRVPRERFVPEAAQVRAYDDHAMGIGHGQTISQPFMVAVMTQALELRGDERVLEVGTGSGYQTAVLAELAAEVRSVELVPELARAAADVLSALGYRHAHVRQGDGSQGWPEEAPYDAILVTAAAPAAPPALLEQLSDEGGILVAPVGSREVQQLVRIERTGTTFSSTTSTHCRFVPLLGVEGWRDELDDRSRG